MAEASPFLSIPEAAARLGVTRIAVFKKVKKGQIAAIRIGRNWAIPVSALETKKPAEKPAVRPQTAPPPGAAAIKSPPPAKPTERTVFKAEKNNLEDMGWD
ncbi:MAG: hypothetical protein A3J79_03285 [Elusimicrobia bacterium RIFOXYB2_FULL_62_6]|nr:MAG: hypothetical protein A3J79_03285 [Elusimicrobia bacterium RIFOXYB2_FULL_62_6]